MIKFSIHKTSSYVVEKCLEVLSKVDHYLFQSTLAIFIFKIFYSNKISKLIKNSYGKYVIDKTISLMDLNQKNQLVEFLKDVKDSENEKINKLIQVLSSNE